jgi:hypothetical protein
MASSGHELPTPEFMRRMEEFPKEEAAAGIVTTAAKVAYRAQQEPFLLIASVILLLAILHTFAALGITKIAHKIQHDHDARVRRERAARGESTHARDLVSFRATILHFFGEVEAIFGIWVVVLLGAMHWYHGLDSVKAYLSQNVNFTEPIFVVVIMALASTRPILNFAESCLGLFAKAGRDSLAAWWLSILIVGPMLGSLITEPGAMTICAMLLARKFYPLKPSPGFAYATIGLLFVNVSVGGVLTNFAAPPVLMVARDWDLTTPEMFLHFGEKAMTAITLSALAYFFMFRKEFDRMMQSATDHDGDGVADVKSNERPVPIFVTITHLFFMAWTVIFSHYPPLFVGAFLFFLAFSQATAHHQHENNLRGPILVGFFLSSLVVHGGLQGWWLGPILVSLTKWPLFIGATVLTSFNDNAAITYLASQAQGLDAFLKYAVLAGAVTGGGLTVIANAPNPAGQAILSRFFGDGVSPVRLAAAALLPTLIVAVCMMLAPDHGVEKIFASPDAEPAPSAAHAGH